ncbi:MAG: TIGR03118 family protein [Burkholderiaceae bacterium]
MPTLSRARRLPLSIALALAATNVAAAAPAANAVTAYAAQNLVSNGVAATPFTDSHLVNTWGVAFNPAGLVWVTNNRSGTSTLYDGTGAPNPLVVNVPPAQGSGLGSPTGIVFSGTSDFIVGNATASGPSRFIFSSEDGVIAGWAPNVDLHNALRVVATPGANYKGLAIAMSSTGARLYATDFQGGRVDMFDTAFAKLATAGAFVDPKLPKDLYPFGIQTIGNQVYVTYAKHGGGLTGGGNGAASPGKDGGNGGAQGGGNADSVVDIFDADGKYLRRAIAQTTLKQPWGLALAPNGFGPAAGRLLVGDFHDGTIGTYDAGTGAFLGLLKDPKGDELRIPGLWGFQFGNGVNSQPTNTLFFAAAPNGQGGGIYGSVSVVTGKAK